MGNTSAAKERGGTAHALLLHVAPLGQVPQVPPQPSSPHCFPEHEGVQPHWPACEQD
jgi:hypothetical protein